MIRRDARLSDGGAAWVLISQIEHARISAQVAAHCLGRFGAGPIADDVRREVLAAIEHHDDGWSEWEESPRLHADSGKPVSFMELEPEEATTIWTRSIAAAEEHGPLAAWMVAGHFARLLEHSEHAHANKQAKAWLDGAKIMRRGALSQWQAANVARHTSEIADEALQWLWTFDELSLWFCCTCPAAEVQPLVSAPRSTKTVGQGTPIEMHLQASGDGLAGATPWRFDVASIALDAQARIVPARRYENAVTLLDASAPLMLSWSLMAPIERQSA